MKEIKKENTGVIQTLEEKMEIIREKTNEIIRFCNELKEGEKK